MSEHWKNDFLAEQLYEAARKRSCFHDMWIAAGLPLTRRQRLRIWWRDNVAWRFAKRPPWEDDA